MVDRPVRTLPARPDLRFLKDEAKRRRRAGEFGSLAGAQFAIAREHGFVSWPQLATFVHTRLLSIAERAVVLVRAACSSDVRTARNVLTAEPELARHDLATACVTGEATVVARVLAAHPDAAHLPTGPNGTPPILYACFTRLLRSDPDRAPGVREVVRLLLAAGADPNTTVAGHEEAPPLYGAAGVANDPALTAMLLEAGADPDDGLPPPDPDDALAPGRPWGNDSLYHAAEFPGTACAELLLGAKPHPIRVSYCLRRALDFDNPPMVEAFLRHGADPDLVPSFGRGRTALINAVIGGHPARVVAGILAAGATVDAVDHTGLTALRHAVRYGDQEVTDLLVAHGADPGTITDEDRWMGAVSAGGAAAEPGLRPDHELLDRAAQRGDVDLIDRLVRAGANVHGAFHGADLPPLHAAAYRGQRDAVVALLAAGADPRAVNRYGGNALDAAIFGSQHCTDPRGGISMRPAEEVTHGDYPDVVHALLAAGVPVPDDIAGSPSVQEALNRHT